MLARGPACVQGHRAQARGQSPLAGSRVNRPGGEGWRWRRGGQSPEGVGVALQELWVV